MRIDTLPKKAALAVLLAYGSVMWLNEWHQYGFSRSRLQFPPVSNWFRDSLTILIPVMLGVWIGAVLAQWLIEISNGRMSLSTQSILAASILAGTTSIVIILIEGSKMIRTGIGNEYVFLASICSRLYPKGNVVLNILQWIFPGQRALRLHILVQDGWNLMLVNLAVTILLMLIIEGFNGKVRSYAYEAG